jgi:putative tricarboxylic transport membrane protein
MRELTADELFAAAETVFSLAGFRRVVVVMLGTALFGIFLEALGFILTTFVFMVFCWLVVDRQPYLRGLLISAAASGTSFILFAKMLNVHVPRGLLGF